MSVLMIARHFASEADGVAAYARNFAQAQRRLGVTVKILTAEAKQDGPDLLVCGEPWGMSGLKGLLKKTLESGCEAVNLQYVPQVYSRFGISPAIVLFLLLVRLKARKKVMVTFHEVYEPFLWCRPWRWPILFLQCVNLVCFLAIADRLIFTTPVHRDRIARAMPCFKSKIHFVPVSSNLSKMPLTALERYKIREALGFKPEDLALGVLSKTLHDALNLELLIEAAAQLNEKGISAKVVLLGALSESNPEYRKRLEVKAAQLAVPLVWTGPMENSDLSRTIQSLDYYMNLIPDGASPRSTALMAAWQHGLPVACGPAAQMAPYPDFGKNVLIVEPLTASRLAEVIASAAAQPEATLQIRKNAELFYEKHFKLEHVAAQLKRIATL